MAGSLRGHGLQDTDQLVVDGQRRTLTKHHHDGCRASRSILERESVGCHGTSIDARVEKDERDQLESDAGYPSSPAWRKTKSACSFSLRPQGSHKWTVSSQILASVLQLEILRRDPSIVAD